MPIPLATMGPAVDASGISIPTYAEILGTLQDRYRSIYGSDVYLESDSQDGQWLAIIAASVNDQNMASVATYNQMSPATAQGAGLSSVVKINGIRRRVPTNSTVDVKLIGQTGTVILNGIVGDTLSQRWSLPAVVAIPLSGEITVTATAIVQGALEAPANSVVNILTPTRGWQSVDNLIAATPGLPVETDAQLRQRQALSVSLPALTPLEALVGAVQSLAGVSQVMPYENDTAATNADGITEHSIALVVEGGDSTEIAQTILNRKTLGTGTFGSTTVNVPDPYGVVRAIKFSRPDQIAVEVHITIEAMTGYTTVIGDQIKQALVDYINALRIGANVVVSRLYLPANLYGGVGSDTFEINTITQCVVGGSPSTADIAIAFDEVATVVLAKIFLTVV